MSGTARSGSLLLAIDQGTTSTRAIAFDASLDVVASAQLPVRARHPQPGWVEQDPLEILDTVVDTVATVLREVGGPDRIAATGLDNQGETVVAWDGETMVPLAPAIVWQCRRSAEIVDRWRAAGLEPSVRATTGLPLDPYFSAGKLVWLLERSTAAQAAAQRGTLRFGTVDAWLTARLGAAAPWGITDPSTASRTQLLSLSSGLWDPWLLDTLGVPIEILPRIVPTAGDLGAVSHPTWGGGSLPLRAIACDQQAALAGHGLFAAGGMKATYGTGIFVLSNAGERRDAVDGLETSIAWTIPEVGTQTVLQGGVLTAGAVMDWLHTSLGLIDDVRATDALARSIPDAAGVRVLPALAGLGAPWYRPHATLALAGLTSAAGPAHIVRAALDGLAHRVADIVEVMLGATAAEPRILRVDGGLTANDYMMTRQADLLGIPVGIAANDEATALGIAGLAGIGAGLVDWEAIGRANPIVRVVDPGMGATQRRAERADWRAFVSQQSSVGVSG